MGGPVFANPRVPGRRASGLGSSHEKGLRPGALMGGASYGDSHLGSGHEPVRPWEPHPWVVPSSLRA